MTIAAWSDLHHEKKHLLRCKNTRCVCESKERDGTYMPMNVVLQRESASDTVSAPIAENVVRHLVFNSFLFAGRVENRACVPLISLQTPLVPRLPFRHHCRSPWRSTCLSPDPPLRRSSSRPLHLRFPCSCGSHGVFVWCGCCCNLPDACHRNPPRSYLIASPATEWTNTPVSQNTRLYWSARRIHQSEHHSVSFINNCTR